MTALAPDSNSLTTPLAWADAAGVILGGNPALARWLGVSSRRLPGVPLAALEVDGEMLSARARRIRRNTA
jgi:two-component system nitrogen regulation sensor histidine kinase GlnL